MHIHQNLSILNPPVILPHLHRNHYMCAQETYRKMFREALFLIVQTGSNSHYYHSKIWIKKLNMTFAMGSSSMTLIVLQYFPSIPSTHFIMKEYWILLSGLSAPMEMIQLWYSWMTVFLSTLWPLEFLMRNLLILLLRIVVEMNHFSVFASFSLCCLAFESLIICCYVNLF